MTGTGPDDESNIPPVPPGTWFQQRPNGFHVGASTRSRYAFLHVPFTVGWTAATLLALYTSLPAYLSAPEDATAQTGLAGAILFAVFLVWLIPDAAMTVAGKIAITIEDNVGSVFTGVGSIGWKRRFDWNARTPVELGRGWIQHRGWGFSSGVIVLGRRTRVWYSGLLSKAQKAFILRVLRDMQTETDKAD